jgi:hypothetical protein
MSAASVGCKPVPWRHRPRFLADEVPVSLLSLYSSYLPCHRVVNPLAGLASEDTTSAEQIDHAGARAVPNNRLLPGSSVLHMPAAHTYAYDIPHWHHFRHPELLLAAAPSDRVRAGKLAQSPSERGNNEQLRRGKGEWVPEVLLAIAL